MPDADAVREMVAESYTRAVKGSSGCCGGSCGPMKSVVVETAGYTDADTEALPADAVASSFGCGNPVAFADLSPGETVLDLGSGAGMDLLIAARAVGPTGRVIGVDMTDEMVRRARANVEAAGVDNVEVRKGLIEALPVEDASVDLIVSNCVINLSPEKERVFAEIARVLKPGGRISISDIVVEDLPDWLRASAAAYAACVAGAVSEAEYIGGLEAAGLEDVAVPERLVYEASQIRAMVESDVPTGDLSGPALDAAAEAAAGQVWSARFTGRRTR